MKMRLKDKIEWRRDQIQQLQAKGYHTVREIANILQIPRATVGKDILYLRQEAKVNIRKYIDETLPEEYERILVGVTSILREAWETSKNEEIDTKEKLSALALAKDCYSMKLDLLTNASVVDDAARFVSLHNREEEQQQLAHNKSLTENQTLDIHEDRPSSTSTRTITDDNNEHIGETTNKVF